MPKSPRFRTLTKELNRLKKQFLPKINPTGLYSDRQLALTTAYTVLAHAEIEAYLEDRVWEVALDAKRNWDSTGKTRRTLICLLAFSGKLMEMPPDTLTPTRGTTTINPEKIKVSKKIDSAISSFNRVIDDNHGIKESNLLALLLPIGIDTDDLTSMGLIPIMNAFGTKRGELVHTSATSYRTVQQLDPQSELSTVQQITQGLLRLDGLLNNLKS